MHAISSTCHRSHGHNGRLSVGKPWHAMPTWVLSMADDNGRKPQSKTRVERSKWMVHTAGCEVCVKGCTNQCLWGRFQIEESCHKRSPAMMFGHSSVALARRGFCGDG